MFYNLFITYFIFLLLYLGSVFKFYRHLIIQPNVCVVFLYLNISQEIEKNVVRFLCALKDIPLIPGQNKFTYLFIFFFPFLSPLWKILTFAARAFVLPLHTFVLLFCTAIL